MQPGLYVNFAIVVTMDPLHELGAKKPWQRICLPDRTGGDKLAELANRLVAEGQFTHDQRGCPLRGVWRVVCQQVLVDRKDDAHVMRSIDFCLLSLFGALACGALPARADEPVSLFDGKTLAGWDVIACEAVVQDNTILLKSGNGLVQTKKRYGDFVLEYEWKALKSEGWDSGVYFRYDKVPAGSPWPERYQVNLRQGGEGDLVGFEQGKNRVPLQAGDWNRCELTVQGSVASLKVNGQKAWQVDGIAVRSGYIALQAEVPGGGKFLFRNIRITIKGGS